MHNLIGQTLNFLRIFTCKFSPVITSEGQRWKLPDRGICRFHDQIERIHEMKSVFLMAGIIAAGLSMSSSANAQQNQQFQPFYSAPLVQLDNNGSKLASNAGIRQGHRFRSRHHSSRRFHRGFHKRRSFNRFHQFKRYKRLRIRKLRKF